MSGCADSEKRYYRWQRRNESSLRCNRAAGTALSDSDRSRKDNTMPEPDSEYLRRDNAENVLLTSDQPLRTDEVYLVAMGRPPNEDELQSAEALLSELAGFASEFFRQDDVHPDTGKLVPHWAHKRLSDNPLW